MNRMSQVLRERHYPNGRRLQIAQGDLTAEAVDAIVNAANRYLQHGGGVAGAISHRGGPVIQAESDEWVREHGPVSHANPAVTSAGHLPAKYVIHAVGPVWGEGSEDEKLESAVRGSLQAAETLALQSVALTAISTGIFGFPKDRAAAIILRVIHQYLLANLDSPVTLVRLTIIDQPTLDVFTAVFDESYA